MEYLLSVGNHSFMQLRLQGKVEAIKLSCPIWAVAESLISALWKKAPFELTSYVAEGQLGWQRFLKGQSWEEGQDML